MTTLCRVDLVARRELALDQEALPVASARAQHDLDATLFNGAAVETSVVLLLELEKAVTCGNEVINELEGGHAVLLGQGFAVRGTPVRNVCRAHYIVFDFTSDANNTDSWPVL